MKLMKDLERRVELCKLMIAIDSMTAVAEASGLALALKADQNHPLYRALHDTIVSSYGRAFTEMQPLGRLHQKWSKFEDETLANAHEMLMYHRHKNVSHTDIIKGRVVIYPKGAVMEDGQTAAGTKYSVLFQSFAPSELIAVQKVAGNLTGRLMLAIHEGMTELYGTEGVDLKSTTDLISEDELQELRLTRMKKNAKSPKSK